MKTSPAQSVERVSRELSVFLEVLDRLTPALRERGLLPAEGAILTPETVSQYVSADVLVGTAKQLWTRAYHPPKHEREEDG